MFRVSIISGWISVLWIIFIVIVLCLPTVSPVTTKSMNYSPLVLGAVIVFAGLWWALDARHWFDGPKALVQVAETRDGNFVVVDKDLLPQEEVEELEEAVEAHHHGHDVAVLTPTGEGEDIQLKFD